MKGANVPLFDNSTLTKLELGWLAGLFDGEGHIGIHRSKSMKCTCRKRSITNTNLGIINECSRLLHKINVFHIVYKNKDNAQRKGGYKQCYTIRIDRTAEMAYLMGMLSPYLKSTDKQLSILRVLSQIENMRRSDGKKPNCRKRKENPTQLQLVYG